MFEFLLGALVGVGAWVGFKMHAGYDFRSWGFGPVELTEDDLVNLRWAYEIGPVMISRAR